MNVRSRLLVVENVPALPRGGRDIGSRRPGGKSSGSTERTIGIAALVMLLFAGVMVGFLIGLGKSEKKPSKVRAEVAQASSAPSIITQQHPSEGSTTQTPTPPTPPTEPKKPEPKKLEPKKPEPKKEEPKKEEVKKPEPNKPEPKKPEPKAVAAVPFAKVSAIFKSNCLLCHGDPTIKGGLDIRTVASIKKGGDSGPGIMPGVPAKSQLWMSIENGEMPPPNKPQLTEAEKKLIKDWIASGAN